MVKDLNLFEKALELINADANLKKVIMSEKTISFLVDFKISNEIIDFFNDISFNPHIRFNHVSFYQVNEMPDENLYEENQRCIA